MPLLVTSLDKEVSLILGTTHLGNPLAVRPTRARRELGNLLIVAPTRGGKGLLATAQLLSWKHSVVVNDIKGDLFTQTAGYRSSLGPVFVIDPTGVGHTLDPLYSKHTEDELYSAATQLLYKPDERQPIFTQRATVMLTQIFLAARQEGRAPLPYAREIIHSGLTACVQRLNAISPELATQFLNIELSQANLGDAFLISSWGTLDTRMRPLLTQTVVRSLARADFRPADLMTDRLPVTVYLRWPERDLLALFPLVRLVWGTLIDELITSYDRQLGKNCNPVLLLIDEAGRTAIPMLADSSTTVVGRGISLWIAVQSLSQLDAVYGKTHASAPGQHGVSNLLQTGKPADRRVSRALPGANLRVRPFPNCPRWHENQSGSFRTGAHKAHECILSGLGGGNFLVSMLQQVNMSIQTRQKVKEGALGAADEAQALLDIYTRLDKQKFK